VQALLEAAFGLGLYRGRANKPLHRLSYSIHLANTGQRLELGLLLSSVFSRESWHIDCNIYSKWANGSTHPFRNTDPPCGLS
jgi:hypothetical protein